MAVKMTLKKQRNTLLMQNRIGCMYILWGSTRDESGFPTTQMTLFTEKEDFDGNIGKHGAKT